MNTIRKQQRWLSVPKDQNTHKIRAFFLNQNIVIPPSQAEVTFKKLVPESNAPAEGHRASSSDPKTAPPLHWRSRGKGSRGRVLSSTAVVVVVDRLLRAPSSGNACRWYKSLRPKLLLHVEFLLKDYQWAHQGLRARRGWQLRHERRRGHGACTRAASSRGIVGASHRVVNSSDPVSGSQPAAPR